MCVSMLHSYRFTGERTALFCCLALCVADHSDPICFMIDFMGVPLGAWALTRAMFSLTKLVYSLGLRWLAVLPSASCVDQQRGKRGKVKSVRSSAWPFDGIHVSTAIYIFSPFLFLSFAHSLGSFQTLNGKGHIAASRCRCSSSGAR